MSDNKNDIDLDKEIESLEGLLNEHDESLDDTFPLDDDFDEELSATPRTQKSKSGAGKYVAYFAFLAVIGGGGYAAYKYLPNMLQNDTLMALQNNVNDRSATVEPQAIIPDTSSIALNTNDTMQVVEPMQMTDALPSAMDDNVDDIIVIDTNNDSGFGDVVEPSISEQTVAEVEDGFEAQLAAETIADALAIAQTAEEEIVIIEEVVNTNAMDEVGDVAVDAEDNTTTSFERVSAMPILKGEDREQLPPVVIDEPVMNDEKAVVEVVVDEVLPVMEDVVTEAPVVEDVPIIEEVPVVDVVKEEVPVAELIEPVIEEMKVPTAPVIEEVVKVEEKTVKPVVVKKSEPKTIVVNNKPLAKVDGRVTQARTAMEQGDFQGALDLYQAVLNNNPSSTSALTGMQLAKAKLRLVGQQVVPQTPDVVTMPVVDNVSSVLAQMVANPRDASLAVKVADLYKAQGNTAKAVEYYRKALQLDVVYKSGLDRMAIYDALSTLQ